MIFNHDLAWHIIFNLCQGTLALTAAAFPLKPHLCSCSWRCTYCLQHIHEDNEMLHEVNIMPVKAEQQGWKVYIYASLSACMIIHVHAAKHSTPVEGWASVERVGIGAILKRWEQGLAEELAQPALHSALWFITAAWFFTKALNDRGAWQRWYSFPPK